MASYNIKNREGAGRWEIDHLEAGRLRRLTEVKSSGDSRRPPRPQALGQARVVSAGRRKPARAHSAAPDHSRPANAAARGSAAHLDALFMLSPRSREIDAQQYVR